MSYLKVPLEHLSYQVRIRYPCLCLSKRSIFICDFSAKVTCAFLAYKKQAAVPLLSLLIISEEKS